MRHAPSRLMIAAFIAGLGAGPALAAEPTPPAPDTHQPTPVAVTDGVWLIPGGMRPNRQPDGNTVVFRAPQGLVVMDTCRHVWQRQAILDFAKTRHAPIVAIVNSHWHLDHVSGNPDLRRAYPGLKVYASNAIDDALKNFLPTSAKGGRAAYDAGGLPPETMEDLKNDLATIDHGDTLRPDVTIDRSGPRTIGGLRLDVFVAPNAATDADVWVYDRKSRVAAVGDLVTIPAPFLDTACVKGWETALDQVWSMPFTTVIPGHGTPMSRAQFATYRAAFKALADCAATKRDKAECAGDWTTATASLRSADPLEARVSKGMSAYYVEDVLRANGGNSAWCKRP